VAGLWFLMATTNIENHCEFWSTKPLNNFDTTHIRLNDYMSRFHFDNILKALTFTAVDPPSYVDRFWEIRQLLHELNTNMDKKIQRHGSHVLTNPCQNGLANLLAQGLLFVRGNHGHLATNTIRFHVV